MASQDEITVTVETAEGRILELKLDFIGDNGEVLTTELSFDHAQLTAAVAAVVGDLLVKASRSLGLAAVASDEIGGVNDAGEPPF